MTGSVEMECIKGDIFDIAETPTCTREKCTGPLLENNLNTNADFPKLYGDLIDVSCEEGFTLQGSAVITCLRGITYSYVGRPRCVNMYLGEYANIAIGAGIVDSNGDHQVE